MKTNIEFKHAVLTKLALIASLLFVALAVALLGSQTLDNQDFIFRNPPCLHGFTAVGTDHDLSVPLQPEPGRQSPSRRSDEARGGTSPNKAACPNQRDSRGAQNSLASGVESDNRSQQAQRPVGDTQQDRDGGHSLGKLAETTSSGSSAPPSQNLQQERGDVLRIHHQAVEHSAASNVQPADAAKISPAELWVRLLEEEKFSIEPAILEGNKIR